MFKKQNIICISSIDWDFIWQGHQEIMSILAANGNRVLFIENTGVRAPGIRDIPRIRSRIKNYSKGVKGIRGERDNLYIYSPIALPFPYSRIARQLNKFLFFSVLKKWMKIVDFADPIIWTFLPTGTAHDIIDNLGGKLVVYYCIDNFYASSASAQKIISSERRLLKKADVVFVTSKALYESCSVYNNNVTIFPFGVKIDAFEKVRQLNTRIPEELAGLNHLLIGYVGGIHKWIDQELIRSLALTRPELTFVFVGPIQTDISILSGIKNIIFLGNKEHENLPYLIKYFSVAIIPYLITDYTRNVYPTKLNEYLSMGKPVISTRLPEIEFFNKKYENMIYIGDTTKDFSLAINKALKEDNEHLRYRRISAAQDNSWSSRIQQMSVIIEEAMKKKQEEREVRWEENLSLFYRRASKKFAGLAFLAASIYTLIFYTPFIWFLAKPLTVVQEPKKADAIVVFAGGVGESGRAGQGYEERVQQAANLYKQGYARNIIFSSGYMYTFKEPLVMKALAISLGIPENAMVLEDAASNTYENVKFTKEILDKNSWQKIILVSSPYHMRRAALTFNKIAKGINVIYVPIENSLFYSHPSRDANNRRIWRYINIQQIKGIFHEYLSIVYYWWNGYI